MSEVPKVLKKALPHSKSAVKCTYGEKSKCNTQKGWQKPPWYEQMKKTNPTTPLCKYVNLIMDLPQKIASILLQLRM